MTFLNEKTHQIEFDPHDFKGMRELMARHEEFPCACLGHNDEGEAVLISINKDNITVETYQSQVASHHQDASSAYP